MSKTQKTVDLSVLKTAILAHEHAQRYRELMRMPGSVDWIMEALVGLDQFLSEVYSIEIDYGTPGKNPDRHYEELFDRLVAAGNYGDVDPGFTSQNFPLRRLTGVVREKLILFDFGREIESAEVVATMPKFLTEPPLVDHCLALGATHPNVQVQNPVVFLGSVWDGCVPYLDGLNDRRVVRLGGWCDVWHHHYRFAANSNVTPSPAL